MPNEYIILFSREGIFKIKYSKLNNIENKMRYIIIFIFLIQWAILPGCKCQQHDFNTYCGYEIESECDDIIGNNLYQCITTGHAPVLREVCPYSESLPASCQSSPVNSQCVPISPSCLCSGSDDQCGSSFPSYCPLSRFPLSHNLYQCSGEGSYPILMWSCPNGCHHHKYNDSCKREPNSEFLGKIKKVVILMQENRAFDNYYGTMAGVRNYLEKPRNVFYQPDPKGVNQFNGIKSTVPFEITGLNSDCIAAGTISWDQSHISYNGGLNNNWVNGSTAYAMGFFTRTSTLQFYFQLAESFTILDQYYQGIMASTYPNRIFHWSGTIDARGKTRVGPVIHNDIIPPPDWPTYPEMLDAANVTWRLYQDKRDEFDCNPLFWFEQFQMAENGSSLSTNGLKYWGMEAFYQHLQSNSLPNVTWLVAPQELIEHPMNGPHGGQWFTQQIINYIGNGSQEVWGDIAFILNYDESGGFFDHVTPPVAPLGTIDEWTYDMNGEVSPIGPGARVPSMMISPFSTGNNVFVENTDHTSVMMFLEEWTEAAGYGRVENNQISKYRRNFMSDYTHSLDFSKDVTFPLPTYVVPTPAFDNHTRDGWIATEQCSVVPGGFTSPYVTRNFPPTQSMEIGFKKVVGHDPSIGRSYVFDMNTSPSGGSGALAVINGNLGIEPVDPSKTTTNQIFQIVPSTIYTVGSQINTTANGAEQCICTSESVLTYMIILILITLPTSINIITTDNNFYSIQLSNGKLLEQNQFKVPGNCQIFDILPGVGNEFQFYGINGTDPAFPMIFLYNPTENELSTQFEIYKAYDTGYEGFIGTNGYDKTNNIVYQCVYGQSSNDLGDLVLIGSDFKNQNQYGRDQIPVNNITVYAYNLTSSKIIQSVEFTIPNLQIYVGLSDVIYYKGSVYIATGALGYPSVIFQLNMETNSVTTVLSVETPYHSGYLEPFVFDQVNEYMAYINIVGDKLYLYMLDLITLSNSLIKIPNYVPYNDYSYFISFR
ncbi:hypothetical protein PPL_01230 [Heterostelium album PN500]|uniref:Phospholipase C n=1 Tax=Heterostelium pallidum (strain ATCC 26659 / Pp 5 / PN500) TaxID=670386 RepID=D3AYH0_HETP5|nr:hypothetical protein PPL_01230 [Heterostelium album PN500]EFA85997.1 hypothetical protein PPL_01230 [Heterostelium album PN500]|eukprot:XP_020438103.1 hypothetical protein PPL_01230 [Heterostelium album PN500]